MLSETGEGSVWQEGGSLFYQVGRQMGGASQLFAVFAEDCGRKVAFAGVDGEKVAGLYPAENGGQGLGAEVAGGDEPFEISEEKVPGQTGFAAGKEQNCAFAGVYLQFGRLPAGQVVFFQGEGKKLLRL